MIRSDFILVLSKETGFAQVDCERFLDSFTNIVKDEVANGGSVRLNGFGFFLTRVKDDYGKKITPFPVFKPGAAFIKAVKDGASKAESTYPVL